MRSIGLATISVVVFLGAGQPKKAEVKDPALELQGGWKMVLLFANGEETPAGEAIVASSSSSMTDTGRS